ncbi:hypothetical protein [Shewanella dokdonensis]|uniref:hypothetical protein n=1 Tax=Shewanella dokdonensis TaxID=712036 RepID=UPI00200E0749|nr:hypothetical protein [Shewanella dokdonensis]MCL1076269.1 hypothetical protein [Shewanella dokdonensis]
MTEVSAVIYRIISGLPFGGFGCPFFFHAHLGLFLLFFAVVVFFTHGFPSVFTLGETGGILLALPPNPGDLKTHLTAGDTAY